MFRRASCSGVGTMIDVTRKETTSVIDWMEREAKQTDRSWGDSGQCFSAKTTWFGAQPIRALPQLWIAARSSQRFQEQPPRSDA
jgi:hypothetical protein